MELADDDGCSVNIAELNEDLDRVVCGTVLLHEGEYLCLLVEHAVHSGFNLGSSVGAIRSNDDE